jgi:site-specific recombinase XerD
VFRLNLLEVTGCKHTRTQIQELVTAAIGLQIRYRQLKDRTGFDHGHEDITEHYKETLEAGIHPIQWFFEHADVAMISDLIRRYGQSRTVRNDLVKSSQNGTHHAGPEVTQMMRFFKGGFRQWLACKDQIDLVNIKRILKTIENKREAADIDTRRTYTTEEVDRILAQSKDPRQELIVTLFREVGLRVTAIGHIRYNMLMTEDGVPREVCTVPEKGNTKRRFVTSLNLKKRIKVYIDYFRDLLHLNNYQSAYIMNLQDPSWPLSSNRIRGILRELATEANITGVRVHPHAFRLRLWAHWLKLAIQWNMLVSSWAMPPWTPRASIIGWQLPRSSMRR